MTLPTSPTSPNVPQLAASRRSRLRPLAAWLALSLVAAPAAADTPRKPDAITTENVPEIPAELWETLGRYNDVHGAAFGDWAPDGESILVSTRHETLSQLHHVARPGAEPRLLTPGDEPARSGFYLPDGSLIFRRAEGGNEKYQIYRRDAATGKEALLSDGQSRHLLSEPHPEGRWIAFSSTRRNGRDADLYLQEPRAGAEARRILKVSDGEAWWLADWAPDGQRAVVPRYVSRNESYAIVLDTASGETTPIPTEVAGADERKMGPAGDDGKGVYRSSFHFGPQGRWVWFLSDARGEFRQPLRVDLQEGEVEWLGEGLRGDAESLELSPDRQRAALTVNVEGYSQLHVIDVAAIDSGATPQTAIRRVDLAPSLIPHVVFSPDGKSLGLSLGRPTSPPEAFSLELESGELTRWTFSERAGFREEDFVNPELIHLESFDGLEISAFVFLPPRRDGDELIPVVITIHGGPESQYRPYFSPSRQFYARELGVAVIAPNVRGSTGYGKTFSLLDNGKKREDSVRDIGALLDWIAGDGRESMRLDPQRIAVKGGSYGGYMVLASLVRFGDRLRAGVDSVGISDFITFLENTSDYRRNLRRAEYGDERDPEMREFFRRISPARQIDKLQSALFLLHGKNDPRVPFSEALQVVEKARSTGEPVWTLYADNEGHGFGRKENRDYAAAATVLFLKRFLLEEDPRTASLRRELTELDAALARNSGERTLHLLRGNVLFKLERFDEAIAAYDRYTEGNPRADAACWQRGLAWYYVGEFEKGRKQFEGYHSVDDLDIENGIWRYLCIAEKEGLSKAVETFLPYPRKVRPPFPELHRLYAGRGSAEAVLEQAEDAARDATSRNRNLFYGHYYIGKYLDVRGDAEEARKHLKKAVQHRIEHFMWDCARIDLEHLDAPSR